MDYVLTDTLVKIVMSGYFPRDFLIKLLEVFIFSIQATWPGHHEFYYTKELATIPQMQIYDVWLPTTNFNLKKWQNLKFLPWYMHLDRSCAQHLQEPVQLLDPDSNFVRRLNGHWGSVTTHLLHPWDPAAHLYQCVTYKLWQHTVLGQRFWNPYLRFISGPVNLKTSLRKILSNFKPSLLAWEHWKWALNKWKP